MTPNAPESVRLRPAHLLLASLATAAALAAPATTRPDILVADFEADDYASWTAEGDAFGPGPARGTLANQQHVHGFLGGGLINTYYRGDGTTGTLTSPEFTVERPFLVFLMGGGEHPGKCCMNLLVGGEPVRTATGWNNEMLDWKAWDVSQFVGRRARLQIVDTATGGWGHINVDHITMTDTRRSAWATAVVDLQRRAEDGTDGTAAWRDLGRRFPELCEDFRKDVGSDWNDWIAGKGADALVIEAVRRAIDACDEWGATFRPELAEPAERTASSLIDTLGLYERVCTMRDKVGLGRDLLAFVRGSSFDTPEFRTAVRRAIRRLGSIDDPGWLPLRQQVAVPRVLKTGVKEIVFAARRVDGDGHWYANFSTWSNNPGRTLYHPGGKLCRLDLETGETTSLIDDPEGGVRDPHMHYDGRTILFSYRKGGQPYYHLYEINVDGTNLRQITDGPYDDIEPVYLPDGDIVFCSSRCNRMVNCYFVRVAVVYRCSRDGGDIRALSTNIEQDNTPWILPDGRILYQRWEYIDRSQVQFHHLWTMNPDGSGQMVYYGNMHGGTVMIDAKPIPGTGKVVASFSPGHGRKEHAGYVTIVDPALGPDDRDSARRLTNDAIWRDPYPLSEDCFLVAGESTDIHVLDGQGRSMPIYELPDADKQAGLWVHEPRPVRPRPRERMLSSAIDPARLTGRVYVQDVHVGRNMTGVTPGEIKNLMVLEVLPKPVNFSGGQEPLSMGGTFTLERILGTVPVEPDGSAFFDVPAMRSLFLVALDENNLSVKRMQSFMTVQPGENLSCVGCHENRTSAPPPTRVGMAMRRPPSRITPISDVPDVYDFPRDIQPILNAHCVACHDYEKSAQGGPRAGGVILAGDRGPRYSHSYATMTRRRLFVDGRNGGGNRAPRSIGSSASRVLTMVDGQHHGVRVSACEKKVLRLWIESAAPYPGTYAALGSGMARVPSVPKEIWERRCASCHKDRQPDTELSCNLTRPEKSLLLLCPLAPEAGGFGMARRIKDGDTEKTETVHVFDSAEDPDYLTILKNIADAGDHLDRIKRFDMPDFRPNEHYVREMKFYGILPADTPDDQSLNPYALDRAYWRSHWYVAPGTDPAVEAQRGYWE